MLYHIFFARQSRAKSKCLIFLKKKSLLDSVFVSEWTEENIDEYDLKLQGGPERHENKIFYLP